MRANLDGSAFETLSTGLNGIRRLALNSAAGKIYWSQPDRIVRANLDGTGQETIYTRDTAAQIVAIDLDLTRNRIYWAEQQTTGCTERALSGGAALVCRSQWTKQNPVCRRQSRSRVGQL